MNAEQKRAVKFRREVIATVAHLGKLLSQLKSDYLLSSVLSIEESTMAAAVGGEFSNVHAKSFMRTFHEVVECVEPSGVRCGK